MWWCLVGWLVGRSVGRLVGWLVGWLVFGWVITQSVCCLNNKIEPFGYQGVEPREALKGRQGLDGVVRQVQLLQVDEAGV